MRIEFHRIMKNANNLHEVGFADSEKQEMTRTPNSIASPASRLAAEKEMIGSEIFADFRPLLLLPTRSGSAATCLIAVAMSLA